jgi:hypothetical protein
VKAGENQGVLLRHDHVVRRYVPLAPWPAASAQRFAFTLEPEDSAPLHPSQVVLVIEAAQTRQPLQALALSCPARS